MKYSIIIPYHSNRNLLNTCIQAVTRTIPKDVEIIIVANNDNPEELGLHMQGQCRVIEVNRSLYYPRAVNLGAQEARGEYIVLMDADICVRRAGWKHSQRLLRNIQTLVGVVLKCWIPSMAV